LSNRFECERRQYDSQIEDLSQRTEDLRLLLAKEKKKYERMIGSLPDTQLRRERDLTATTNLGTAIQSKVGHPLER
jgi:hypothetical protein